MAARSALFTPTWRIVAAAALIAATFHNPVCERS